MTQVVRQRHSDVTTYMTEEQVAVVKRTVAKGATDDELAMFLALAQKYELDPFAKELWCACPLDANGERKMKNGQPEPAIIMASRDGFLAIANRHPAYDGMTSEVVRENDDFLRLADETIHHSYGAKDRGKIVGAYAIVYRTDRRKPSSFFAPWNEYGEPNARDREGKIKHWSPWSRYPSAMCIKVAEAQALKKAFSISGIVSEAEMDAGQAIEDGAQTALVDRAPLHTPQVSPASRGIGRAHTTLATPAETLAARAAAIANQELPPDPGPLDDPTADDDPICPECGEIDHPDHDCIPF